MILEEQALLPKDKVQSGKKHVPPDGGWGWMVLLGTAVCNIFNQSMLSQFGLLYGDTLEAMGHRTQGAAVVISTMLFVTNFGGPIAGAIVKLSSPRYVAVVGACLCSTGIFLSGFSTNLWHLTLSYGVLLGLGLGFIQNSTFVAINAYFKSNKSRAVGLAHVGTGLGQTVMPHVVRCLLENYGFRGACVMLSALSLHGICGTLLIEPVEKHMKLTAADVRKEDSLLNNKEFGTPFKSSDQLMRRTTDSDVNDIGHQFAASRQMSWLHKLYDLFDISLLSSPRFLNVVIGTALSVTSIQSFSMLYPFFLQKVANMDKEQTATCMSAVAVADICGRFILPVFQEKYHIKVRWMLILACIWLMVTRQVLAYQTDLYILIAMSSLYGFGRSTIIVGRNIAISENCKMEQVPTAVGLGMLMMSAIVPPTGYFLGWIRDYTGSYVVCITAQNILLVFILAMWIPDMLIMRIQEKTENRKKTVEMLM